MRSMGDLAETLEALAVCDEALGSLRAELEQLPVSIERAETRDAETRARLDAMRQAFADFEHTRREKEAELQDCEVQRDRFRAQTAQVKTNTEYTALLHEIDGATSRISQLEEEVLVAMDEVDERRQALADLETEQKQVERETEARVGDLRKRLEQVQREIEEREGERDGWLERLEPSVRAQFRLVASSRGSGTARIRGRSCSACHRDVPLETINRVTAGDLHTCTSCTRILVGDRG